MMLIDELIMGEIKLELEEFLDDAGKIKYYISPPESILNLPFKTKLKHAWMVLTGRAAAFQFKRDEVKNRKYI